MYRTENDKLYVRICVQCVGPSSLGCNTWPAYTFSYSYLGLVDWLTTETSLAPFYMPSSWVPKKPLFLRLLKTKAPSIHKAGCWAPELLLIGEKYFLGWIIFLKLKKVSFCVSCFWRHMLDQHSMHHLKSLNTGMTDSLKKDLFPDNNKCLNKIYYDNCYLTWVLE